MEKNEKNFVMDKSITPGKEVPKTTDLTQLFKHGGIHSILDAKTVELRLTRGIQHHTKLEGADAAVIAAIMASKHYFCHLVPHQRYNINSALISHISLYERGTTFSHPAEEINPNNTIPTFLTFAGQFVDHDLTLNMIDLIGRAGNAARVNIPGDIQTYSILGEDPKSPDEATPFIDLDSVYGMREVLVGGEDPAHPDAAIWNIIDRNTGKFFMHYDKYFDFCRIKKEGKDKGVAYIFDKRNEDNQILSQIHLLILRLHNTLASDTTKFPLPATIDETTITEYIKIVRKEVVRTWQSVLWNDYLPKLINATTLNEIRSNLDSLKKPKCMPHEFSISFRMGHSQLRPGYRLQSGNKNPIPLFDNFTVPPNDLRGSKPLEADHVIEWPYFIDESQSKQTSNKIDTKVTSVVFNLPESTIPDNVKGIANLPQRNLMRSEQVRIASGEKLAAHYGINPLTPDEIEPNPDYQMLFQIDNAGHYKDGNEFRTPLWYYVIKEAELLQGGTQLGPVGGRIIGDVITAAIWHQNYSFNNPAVANGWKAFIKNETTNEVMFQDIVDYVLANEKPDNTPKCPH